MTSKDDDVYGFHDYDDPDLMHEFDVPTDQTGGLRHALGDNAFDDFIDDDTQL